MIDTLCRALVALSLPAVFFGAPADGAVTRIGGRAGAASIASQAARALRLSPVRFTLPNGLRVVVRTDRKAPLVSVSVLYAVGARNETAERIGFAHLFEHLMFNGSERAPGDFFQAMRDIGATNVNGNTGYDTTIFYETVPTGALARTLFLEAARMGHMDGAIDRAMLDRNRAIVRNEKRQNDNQPYAAAYVRVFERLFPAGHPYGHPVQGSLAALDAATVTDARAWHRRFYTPANAVLVLAGDIDAPTARTLVQRYFGDLPGGTRIARPHAPVPRLAAPIADTATDTVGQTSVTRHWATPGWRDADGPALDIAAKILGTLTGAWLDKALVRDERLATAVMTSAGAAADSGTFVINYSVAPGVDPDRVARRLDATLARFLREGPSADEIARVTMREIGLQTQTLETTGGQAAALGEGALLSDDPDVFRRTLLAQARLRPADVRAAAARWLTRPAYTLTIVPGARPASAPAAETPAPPARPRSGASLPSIEPTPPPGFPVVRHTRLSNGMEVVHARRAGVPLTRVVLDFEGGAAADRAGEAGGQRLLFAMLGEGTTTRDAAAIARTRERLGATLYFDSGAERSGGNLAVPSVGASRALDLMAEMVRHPALAATGFAAIRAARRDRLRQAQADPGQLAQRTLASLLYGDSAYGRTDAGEEARALDALTLPRVRELARAWLRPEKATLFVVSDLPIEAVTAMAERAFGGWRGVGPAGKSDPTLQPPATPRIVLIDRPGSPQSVVLGGMRSALDPHASLDTLFAALAGSDALGGFRGRINDDLRERNGWSYGAGGGYALTTRALSYTVSAPVQTDRTGDAIAHLRDQLAGYAGDRPITQDEFDRSTSAALSGMAGRYERGDSVIDAMVGDALFGRPDAYQAQLPARYRALTREQVIAATRRAIDPRRFVWVVVGDAARVRPQLESLGLPVVERPGTPP